MSAVVKNPSAKDIPELNDNLKDMALQVIVRDQIRTDTAAGVTTETADITYSQNEVDMLNHLKKDVANLISTVNNLIGNLKT